MFHDLDATLAELLKRELPASLSSQVSVSFATPDGKFPPASVTLPTVNLFLYEVQENRDLRSREPVLERQPNGRVLAAPAPVRVDCRYQVTAWPSVQAPQPYQDEHRLLGEAMRVLLRYRELPTEVLRGSLTSQALPVRAVTLQDNQQPPRGEVWQALGGKPKASFYYAVTVCVDLQSPEDAGPVAQRALVG